MPAARATRFPVDPREAGQGQLQGVRPVSSMALGLDRQVELFGQGQTRHRQAHAVGFVQGDAHVLDEVLDEEAGIEVVVDDSRAQDWTATNFPRRRRRPIA